MQILLSPKHVSYTHTYTHTDVRACLRICERVYVTYTYIYMGQVIEKRTIGPGQAKIIKLTITLNNFITLE